MQALVEAVTGRYDVCVRYYRVKKRLLGVGDLHEWDRYAPIGQVSRDLSWERSEGTGAVYSWTTIWRPQTPDFTVPYAAVIVDMDEGWQTLSNVIGCEHEAVHIGMRVAVEFHPITDGVMLPYFRPV